MPRRFEPASGGELIVLYCTLAAASTLLAASCSAALQHQHRVAPLPDPDPCPTMPKSAGSCPALLVGLTPGPMSLAAVGGLKLASAAAAAANEAVHPHPTSAAHGEGPIDAACSRAGC